MLLYENKYFVEKIEIRKNMLKDLIVSLNLIQTIVYHRILRNIKLRSNSTLIKTQYKWNLHGGKTTMLYLNLSGHNIFKKRFGTSPEKHCLTAMLYRLFSRKLAKLT